MGRMSRSRCARERGAAAAMSSSVNIFDDTEVPCDVGVPTGRLIPSGSIRVVSIVARVTDAAPPLNETHPDSLGPTSARKEN